MVRFAIRWMLPLCLLTVASCGDWEPFDTVHGSGVIARQSRTVAPFTRLRVTGSADIDFTRAAETSVVVEADDNIVPLVDTSSVGDTLQIATHQNYSSVHPVRVIVTGPALKQIELVGSSDTTVNNLAGDHFDAAISGSGDLKANGTVNSLNVQISGSGDAFLAPLRSTDAVANISGSGDIELTAARSLDASVSGSGDIECSGHPSQVQQHVSGSGNVHIK